ncbi:hypothetical protein FDG2_5024 [Candidatus Protofrankia californiensis]|uniref:Putative pterin-4-alpha-carbinolamine dehydratase n=1 Tax=Candidatus Protofrankia californiensis TaxID=1839754 RepID=A0A1C3PA83_9ACTN|nr:hypothetical protein FDG2_5024 [Candidatus Protofrankia californiensis]
MRTVPVPLSDSEIERRLRELPSWSRVDDEITKTFSIRYHGGVALIVHVADVERRIGHYADIDLRWDSIRFGITTHDAGHRITAADFDPGSVDIDDCAAFYQTDRRS